MTAQHSPESTLSLLRSTLDATHDAIIVTDSSGTILERNDQFAKLWGLPATVLRSGKHQLVLEHNANLFDDPHAYLLRVREVNSLPEPALESLRLKDGRVFERFSKPIPLAGQQSGRIWSYRDITTSNQLAELNSRLAAIVESADDAIVSKTLEGTVTSWNNGAERIFGYQAAEMIGHSITVLIPEARLHEESEILARIRSGERIDHYETVRLRKDGEPILVSLSISPVRDATGTIIGASKIAHDITKQKRADETQARLAAIVESSDDAIISKTLEGIITSWNRGAERVFGYTAEEIVGKHVTTLFPPELIPEEQTILGRIRQGQPINHYETERVRKDGQRIIISLTVSPVRDPSGRIIGASKIARDISQQRQQQEALRASEQKLRAVLDVSPECVKIVAPDGTLEFMNEAGLCMIECDSEKAAVGQCFFDLIVPEHRPEWIANHQSVCRGNRLAWEFQIISTKGERRWMETHAAPLSRADGQFAQLAVTRDITDRKQHDEEREALLESERAARSAAEHANRLKDEFLATVSHELRTPLNAILGWSQLLTVNCNPTDLQQGLEAIQRNARVQTQLIEDLLDMSRILSGKVRLDVQATDVATVIEAAVDAVQLSADAKSIRLRKILDPQAGPVSGDPTRLQQVFWNLLSNAIKFTPKGGRVDVLLERVNSHLEVTVHDSGVGIKPEHLPVVFERFRQVDSSITRNYGGLGLGLAIVKHLVELHGGTVRAKSAGEGQGATFIVALPLAPLRSSEVRIHPTAPQASVLDCESLSLEQVKILMVDDEADSRALVTRLLGQCGAEVRTAASAEEGLQVLIDFQPDVLISDIGMPGKDGYQFIRDIRALEAISGGKLPAIALTAFARSEDRTRAMMAGYHTHIAKPIEPQELLATVGSLAGKTGRS